MASFTYDGGANISATFDSVAGHTYQLAADDPDSSTVNGTGTGSPLTLNITDAGGPAGTHFYIIVFDFTDNTYVAVTMAAIGQTSDQDLAISWSYDGAHAVSATFHSTAGWDYELLCHQGDGTSVGSDANTASGASLTLSATISTPTAGLEALWFSVFIVATGTDSATTQRLATYGSSSLGYTTFGSGPPPPMPPIRRFFRGYPWRFIVTDLNTQTLTLLDRLASARTVTKAMDQPMDASGHVPSDSPEINILHTDGDPFMAEGNRLVYGFRREGWDGSNPPWVCRFAGVLDHLEDIVGTNSPVTQWTARDPWQYMYSRPVRLADGQLSGPLGRVFLAADGWTPTTIAQQLLLDTIAFDGPCFVESGTVADSVSIGDVTFQQGLSVGAAWDQLCATNKVHIVLDPVYDPVGHPGICSYFNAYPDIGQVRNAAIFAWDLPSRSLLSVDRIIDGTLRANSIQFYFGQGGPPVDLATDAASIAKYGNYWAQQFWPGFKQAGPVAAMAAQQLLLLRNGSVTYQFAPAPERSPIPFDDYDVGDYAPFYASKKLRAPLQPTLVDGAWADLPRIRAFTIQIADNQTETVSQLLTSFEGEASVPAGPHVVVTGTPVEGATLTATIS